MGAAEVFETDKPLDFVFLGKANEEPFFPSEIVRWENLNLL
jgi:hypothetical protein